MVVVRFFAGSVAIRYMLPVSGLVSYLHIMARRRQRDKDVGCAHRGLRNADTSYVYSRGVVVRERGGTPFR